MRIAITQMLLALLLSISSQAQKINFFSTVSPKLGQFITAHPEASLMISNVGSEVFQNRKIQIYYFYTDDDSVPRAFHYYHDESTVDIVIRENQQPSDECICLIFEMLNSEGEKRFLKLEEEAKSGTVTKADFVKGVMQQEFQAGKKMRALLGNLRLSKKEIAESYSYNRILHCPNDFEEFLSYTKKVSPNRDQVKEYEREYDYLRNSESRSNNTLQPTATAPSDSTKP